MAELAFLLPLAFLAGYVLATFQHMPPVRAGRRSNGNCVPLPPAPPGPRRSDRYGPIKAPPGNVLAECGGPCGEECWQACDCGLFEQLNPQVVRKPRPHGGRLIREDRDPGPPPTV